ncbi:MAG: 50S ribosomal protein L6 [Candidatus Moranbacteria bacterium RIFOXYA12_FULL_44_15]|nr:MAG: 50S ribosomal protein L6 [Candidatus Moranbacteria bacterium RIFOXYA12_FULL_44_15]OGI34233.1 MAG: 50S ribosomal protein L6 [Candidatus Moranbacteria bacterium RIFOXYA2_FULL_43_15]
MSKIGKKSIAIPEGVEVKIDDKRNVEIKGPKGTLGLKLYKEIELEIEDKKILVKKSEKFKEANAFWGLTRALVNNMVTGVSAGYEKKLELKGVGFRMSLQGKKLVMALGFSHPVEIEVPENIIAKVEDNNILSISGIDKQAVGQFAANVRALKKVEPYKGKGFRYTDEQVRRKVGKKAGTAK